MRGIDDLRSYTMVLSVPNCAVSARLVALSFPHDVFPGLPPLGQVPEKKTRNKDECHLVNGDAFALQSQPSTSPACNNSGRIINTRWSLITILKERYEAYEEDDQG